jgi:hypothetical protein
MKRANVKSAEVVLRTAPSDRKFFALNRQGPSAAASSDLTDSLSAEVSTGTGTGDPQLPRPTQTLRAKPARPARRSQ